MPAFALVLRDEDLSPRYHQRHRHDPATYGFQQGKRDRAQDEGEGRRERERLRGRMREGRERLREGGRETSREVKEVFYADFPQDANVDPDGN